MDIKVNRKVKCIETLVSEITEKDFPLESVIMFGSFATGTFHERSDLDLCLVHDDDKEPTYGEKVEIESYFDKIVGAEMAVDYIYVPVMKMKTGNQVFNSIRESGLVLWEHSGK